MRTPSKTERKRWAQEALTEVMAGRAPDFSLASLRTWPREALLVTPGDTGERADLKRTALTLALIFNDLKDLAWPRQVLGHWEPTERIKANAYAGQHSAMQSFFLRHICAVVAELAKVLEAKRALFSSDAFKAASKALRIRRPSALAAWEAVLAAFEKPIVDGKKTKAVSKVARCMKFIRDKAAYHYGHEHYENLAALAGGYARHFSSEKEEERHSAAYVSLGENMEQSRFYFADAAVQQVMNDAFAAEGVTPTELHDFVHDVNFALRFVVEAVVEHLQRSDSR